MSQGNSGGRYYVINDERIHENDLTSEQMALVNPPADAAATDTKADPPATDTKAGKRS